MWELDYNESWAPKNWCFWTVVLEKTLESHLDCKEIQPVNSKGNQSWIFIGRTDVEAETPILWPPDAKKWLTGKDPDAGKDWRWEEKGGDRGWDGWMTPPTQWTWVWVSSESWWWTGRPGVLQSVESQRVGRDWAELRSCTAGRFFIVWATRAAPWLNSNKIKYIILTTMKDVGERAKRRKKERGKKGKQ